MSGWVKRPGVLSKVQMLNLVLGVGVLFPSSNQVCTSDMLTDSVLFSPPRDRAISPHFGVISLLNYTEKKKKKNLEKREKSAGENSKNRGRELNTNLFFSNFSGTPGTSRQNPGISRPKVWFPCVSRDIPNFLAPTRSRGRPPPHRKISGTKSLGLGSFFQALLKG